MGLSVRPIVNVVTVIVSEYHHARTVHTLLQWLPAFSRRLPNFLFQPK